MTGITPIVGINIAFHERIRMLAKTEMTEAEFLGRVEELTWFRDRLIEMVKANAGEPTK